MADPLRNPGISDGLVEAWAKKIPADQRDEVQTMLVDQAALLERNAGYLAGIMNDSRLDDARRVLPRKK